MVKKHLKNLLHNQKSYDLETWNAASGSYINDDSGLALTYIRYLVAYVFELGETVTNGKTDSQLIEDLC